MLKKDECPAISDQGISCIRKLYFSENSQEWWDHPGGHIFMTKATQNVLSEEHVDATALLSGLPASHHLPEDCTYEGFCAWRKPEKR